MNSIVLWVLAVSGSLSCTAQVKSNDVSRETIEKQVEALGSDSVEERAAARKHLEAIGLPGVVHLRELLPKQNSAIQSEISEVTKNIAIDSGAKTLRRLQQALVEADTLQVRYSHIETYSEPTDNSNYSGRMVFGRDNCVLFEAVGMEEGKQVAYSLAHDGSALSGRYGLEPFITKKEDSKELKAQLAKRLLELGPHESAVMLWSIIAKNEKDVKAQIHIRKHSIRDVSLDLSDRDYKSLTYTVEIEDTLLKQDVRLWFDPHTNLLLKRTGTLSNAKRELGTWADTFEGWIRNEVIPKEKFQLHK
jgi:hypothetical protein